MGLALLMALQVAGPSAPPAAAIDFDLATHRPAEQDLDRARQCQGDNPSEIVVCGRRRRGNDYRFEEMARLFREEPLVAETAIAPNATLRAYGESAGMPNGQISKRAMVGVKLRF